MIDPHTDAIQAIGRFRNGIDKVYHIFNTNINLPIRTRKEINIYMQASEEVYKTLKTFYDCATSKEARNAYREALNILPYNKILDKEGQKNFFAIDNYLDEALLKSSYNSKEGVFNNYKSNPLFDTEVQSGYYPYGDFERLKKNSQYSSLKERTNAKREATVRQAKSVSHCSPLDNEQMIFEIHSLYN